MRATGRLLAAFGVCAACGACASSAGPQNRAGVAVVPGVAGAEVERFVDGDGDAPSLSAGVTLGLMWRTRELFDPVAGFDSLVFAVNPFVRWYFWQPADWFATAWDAKLSFVLLAPGRSAGDLRLLPALESHLALSFQEGVGYLLVGAGVKQFLTSREISRGGQLTRFPTTKTLFPAGELSLGLQF